MTSFEDAWGATTTEVTEHNVPNPGTHTAIISDARMFTSKAKDRVLVIEYTAGEYLWADIRKLTKDGEPQLGVIKSAKIALSQLGLNPDQPAAAVEAAVASVKGKSYLVEVVQTDIQRKDGSFILNTNIEGPVKAPAPPVPAAAPAAAGSAEDVGW